MSCPTDCRLTTLPNVSPAPPWLSFQERLLVEKVLVTHGPLPLECSLAVTPAARYHFESFRLGLRHSCLRLWDPWFRRSGLRVTAVGSCLDILMCFEVLGSWNVLLVWTARWAWTWVSLYVETGNRNTHHQTRRRRGEATNSVARHDCGEAADLQL